MSGCRSNKESNYQPSRNMNHILLSVKQWTDKNSYSSYLPLSANQLFLKMSLYLLKEFVVRSCKSCSHAVTRATPQGQHKSLLKEIIMQNVYICRAPVSFCRIQTSYKPVNVTRLYSLLWQQQTEWRGHKLCLAESKRQTISQNDFDLVLMKAKIFLTFLSLPENFL